MPTIPMVVTKSDSIHYGGERRFTGDRFSVRGQSDARLLRALGWAADAPPDPMPIVAVAVEPRQTYRTRALNAEVPAHVPFAEPIADSPVEPAAEPEALPAAIVEQADDEPRQKRAYRRRDMRAES